MIYEQPSAHDMNQSSSVDLEATHTTVTECFVFEHVSPVSMMHTYHGLLAHSLCWFVSMMRADPLSIPGLSQTLVYLLC